VNGLKGSILARDEAQVVECLISKYKVLSSNPRLQKKKKKVAFWIGLSEFA
jgi:hypothetical protein